MLPYAPVRNAEHSELIGTKQRWLNPNCEVKKSNPNRVYNRKGEDRMDSRDFAELVTKAYDEYDEGETTLNDFENAIRDLVANFIEGAYNG